MGSPIDRRELLKKQCRLGEQTACLTLEALELARRQGEGGERGANASRLDEGAPVLDEGAAILARIRSHRPSSGGDPQR